jgi:hypothetical protein
MSKKLTISAGVLAMILAAALTVLPTALAAISDAPTSCARCPVEGADDINACTGALQAVWSASARGTNVCLAAAAYDPEDAKAVLDDATSSEGADGETGSNSAVTAVPLKNSVSLFLGPIALLVAGAFVVAYRTFRW